MIQAVCVSRWSRSRFPPQLHTSTLSASKGPEDACGEARTHRATSTRTATKVVGVTTKVVTMELWIATTMVGHETTTPVV